MACSGGQTAGAGGPYKRTHTGNVIHPISYYQLQVSDHISLFSCPWWAAILAAYRVGGCIHARSTRYASADAVHSPWRRSLFLHGLEPGGYLGRHGAFSAGPGQHHAPASECHRDGLGALARTAVPADRPSPAGTDL